MSVSGLLTVPHGPNRNSEQALALHLRRLDGVARVWATFSISCGVACRMVVAGTPTQRRVQAGR